MLKVLEDYYFLNLSQVKTHSNYPLMGCQLLPIVPQPILFPIVRTVCLSVYV